MTINPIKRTRPSSNNLFIFKELGWKILRHKALYYELGGDTQYDYFRITDEEFDSMSKEYKRLANKLKLKPTATDAIDFNINQPSHVLALTKILFDQYQNNKILTTSNKKIKQTRLCS